MTVEVFLFNGNTKLIFLLNDSNVWGIRTHHWWQRLFVKWAVFFELGVLYWQSIFLQQQKQKNTLFACCRKYPNLICFWSFSNFNFFFVHYFLTEYKSGLGSIKNENARKGSLSNNFRGFGKCNNIFKSSLFKQKSGFLESVQQTLFTCKNYFPTATL